MILRYADIKSKCKLREKNKAGYLLCFYSNVLTDGAFFHHDSKHIMGKLFLIILEFCIFLVSGQTLLS